MPDQLVVNHDNNVYPDLIPDTLKEKLHEMSDVELPGFNSIH